MTDLKVRPVKQVLLEFNTTINGLIKMVSCRVNNPQDLDQIDRVKKRLNLLRGMADPELIIRASGGFFMKYRELIEEKKLDQLIDLNPSEECATMGIQLDATDSYMFSLFDNIRPHIKSMKPNEKVLIANDILKLYSNYLEYVLSKQGLF